jgi:hypothetical protein
LVLDCDSPAAEQPARHFLHPVGEPAVPIWRRAESPRKPVVERKQQPRPQRLGGLAPNRPEGLRADVTIKIPLNVPPRGKAVVRTPPRRQPGSGEFVLDTAERRTPLPFARAAATVMSHGFVPNTSPRRRAPVVDVGVCTIAGQAGDEFLLAERVVRRRLRYY